MNLKERKKKYMESFGGRKRKEEMMSIYYNFKHKIKNEMLLV